MSLKENITISWEDSQFELTRNVDGLCLDKSLIFFLVYKG